MFSLKLIVVKDYLLFCSCSTEGLAECLIDAFNYQEDEPISDGNTLFISSAETTTKFSKVVGNNLMRFFPESEYNVEVHNSGIWVTKK